MWNAQALKCMLIHCSILKIHVMCCYCSIVKVETSALSHVLSFFMKKKKNIGNLIT